MKKGLAGKLLFGKLGAFCHTMSSREAPASKRYMPVGTDAWPATGATGASGSSDSHRPPI